MHATSIASAKLSTRRRLNLTKFPFEMQLVVKRLGIVFPFLLMSHVISVVALYLTDDVAYFAVLVICFDVIFLWSSRGIVAGHSRYRDAVLILSETGIALEGGPKPWNITWDSIKRIHISDAGRNIRIRRRNGRPIQIWYFFDPQRVAEELRTTYADRLEGK
jgi:hypothetical protein